MRFFALAPIGMLLCCLLAACTGLERKPAAEVNAALAAGNAAAGKALSPPPAQGADDATTSRGELYQDDEASRSEQPPLVKALTMNNTAQLDAGARAQLRNLQPLLSGAEQYRIGVGDVLRITQPVPSTATAQTASVQELTVDADGVVDLGEAAGAYRVAGLTALHAQRVLQAGLQTQLDEAPRLRVEVVKHQSQFVQLSGEIYAPGSYAIDDTPMTLAQAIARGGSLLQTASIEAIQLTRGGQHYVLNLRTLYTQGVAPQDIVLRAGDRVFIPHKNAIQNP